MPDKVAIFYSRADGTVMYDCAPSNVCGEVNLSSVVELLEVCERLKEALTQVDKAVNKLEVEAKAARALLEEARR